MMKRIGVFLSARENLPEAYLKAAEEVGCWIGRTGRQLVYGGAAKGQMERLAQTVKAYGGTVIGVIPQVIKDRGLISEQCDITFFTADLSDRARARCSLPCPAASAHSTNFSRPWRPGHSVCMTGLWCSTTPVVAGTVCSTRSTVCTVKGWSTHRPINSFT